MKDLKLIATILSIFLLIGCSSWGVTTVFDQNASDCTIYELYGATPENSLIAAKISNPCKAKQLLGTLVKMPAIEWEDSYTIAFDSWANMIESQIREGISPYSLMQMINIQIAKLNDKAGLTLMVLTDGLLVFKEGDVFKPVDQQM